MGAYSPTAHQEAHGTLYLYDDTGSDVTVTTAGTYYQFTDFTVGHTAGLAVASAATDAVTIQTGGAGHYDIAWTMCSDGTNAAEMEAAAFVNGNEIKACCAVRELGTPSRLSAMSATCTTALADGDVIDLRVTSNGNGDSFSVHRLSLTVVRH